MSEQNWSDAELRGIGDAVLRAGSGVNDNRLAMGRAAVNAIAPRVRAEALKEALAEPTNDEIRESKAVVGRVWDDRDFTRAKVLFANRLQRLTAKPDPLREAIMGVFREHKLTLPPESEYSQQLVGDLVAAVRRADSGGGR